MRIMKPVERWFPTPKDPDKSEVLIRHLLPGELLDTINEASNQETRYVIQEGEADLRPEMISRSKPGEIQRRQYLMAVRDWKNFFDESGSPMECTDENKVRAMRSIEGFIDFVSECRRKLAVDVERERVALEKN